MAQKKVTLKEIAKRTGVSLGTVHRAIYGKAGISEKTRARILEEVKRSHYQIDEAASVLKRSAKRVVVVLPGVRSEEQFYFRGLWKGIRQAARGMEQYKIYFQCIVSEYPLSEMWRELEKVYDEMLDDIDGLITIADSEKANVWISRFARRGISTVLLSSYYEDHSMEVSCIKVDHKRCGRLAAEFMRYGLKENGGKVLMFCGNREIYSNRIYAENFEEELRKSGYEIIKVEGFGREEIEKAASGILKNEQIQGIFMNNARNTYSVCGILQELQLGKDMMVVGTDAFQELSPYFEEGILNAVICQYHWQQGAHAVKKMYEYLSRGIQDKEDEILSPVLLLKNNYSCFL